MFHVPFQREWNKRWNKMEQSGTDRSVTHYKTEPPDLIYMVRKLIILLTKISSTCDKSLDIKLKMSIIASSF